MEVYQTYHFNRDGNIPTTSNVNTSINTSSIYGTVQSVRYFDDELSITNGRSQLSSHQDIKLNNKHYGETVASGAYSKHFFKVNVKNQCGALKHTHFLYYCSNCVWP